jgi:serine O-acetyltransferase
VESPRDLADLDYGWEWRGVTVASSLRITSRAEYKQFLKADWIALNRGQSSLLHRILVDDIWMFQKALRRLEYLTNCRKARARQLIGALRLRRISRKLGFSIPINVFGPGLAIAHRGTIVVNPHASVGANCRMHVCVNIGTAAGEHDDAPVIGDNCYIGPGAKIFGKIIIGPDTVIGANAVVNRSFPEGSLTIGGVPARKISSRTSEGLLIKGHMACTHESKG